MELVCLLLGRCIRVGCVLRILTIDHVYDPAGRPRDVVGWNEEKTKKWRTLALPGGSRLREGLERYWASVADLPRTAPLFYGKKTGQELHDKGVKKLLAEFVGRRGIEQCSPHSFRKYGGRYLYFQCGIEIEVISVLLNHSSVRETRIYLDIQAKDVARAETQLVV
jgi:integrase